MRSNLPIVVILPALAIAAMTVAAGRSSPATPVRAAEQGNEGNSIVNLYDAFGPSQAGLTPDFGFSALVRYNGKTILFDSGSNADLLKANTEALGIDLRDVDYAVASHAHFDHINGFDYLLEVNPDIKLYFPADFFWGASTKFSVAGPEPDVANSLPVDQRYFGGAKEEFTLDQSGRFWKANVVYVGTHTEIAPGVTLIATRSPFMGYFTRYPSLGGLEGLQKTSSDVKTIDLPELSLNLETPDGDVLLVGCSHSLVETIVRSTREHLDRKVALVFGGYHLLPYRSSEIREIATRMKEELGVAGVAPTHCTGHAGFKVFREVFGDRYHAAGLGTTTSFPGVGSGTASTRRRYICRYESEGIRDDRREGAPCDRPGRDPGS
jgi:7,8-dihydropterin-6-yl-methyl-4-(beta-D-ribofuranosyl)aminobenzene 5'-phosphate synthase